MRIINLSEFKNLPQGTIYSGYEPQAFKGLFVKGAVGDYDYFEESLIGNIDCCSSTEFFELLDLAEITGASLKLDFDCFGRNGLFNNDQLYAVYEIADLKGLIKILMEAIIE